MFLKREVRRKDGKEHVYYSLAETTRVGRDRVVQRRLLNLGELNTTQIDRWQRSIEVIEEDGRACQRRLFSDREGQAPQQEEDVCEVVLSSLSVRRPRRLGDCWLGCRLWEELGLDKFWFQALGDRRGAVEWSKVMQLLAVNRLCAPGSESVSTSDGFRARRWISFWDVMRRWPARIVSIELWTRRSNIAMRSWAISRSAGTISLEPNARSCSMI